jgi:hypothetical protein
MSRQIKWVLAAVMVLSVVIIAQATAQNIQYLPIIYIAPTPTPTRTPTQKPTECIVQVFPVSELEVCFTDIVYKPTTSPLDEWVTIKNLGDSAVEMEGWRISSDTSNKYDFPEFTLNKDQTVKVWTKNGTNSSTQLYMNREFEFWKDTGDCGYLKDDTRKTINSFCYSTTGLFAPAEE